MRLAQGTLPRRERRRGNARASGRGRVRRGSRRDEQGSSAIWPRRSSVSRCDRSVPPRGSGASRGCKMTSAERRRWCRRSRDAATSGVVAPPR
eukprot:3657116-Pleurochrysis_carterae.AAC.1